MDGMSAIIDWWLIHLKELTHDLIHMIMIPAALWFWQERKILKDVLEDHLERRQKEPNMIDLKSLNILTELPKDIAILLTVLPKIQAAIPLMQKNMADLQKAIADQKDPAALLVDINTLLEDANEDLKVVSDILPPKAPAAPLVA